MVALLFPGGDFGDEAIFFVNASVEALAAQDADFDFDHVQPTGVLGAVKWNSRRRKMRWASGAGKAS